MREKCYRLVALALLGGLGLLLAGCGSDSTNRTIPNEFTGDYAGVLTAVPGGAIGAIRATVFPSGSVQFDVSATGGSFIATGGINSANQLTASGFFNNSQIDFIGTWSADGFGAASGTWIDRTSNDTGTWSIVQEGLSVGGAAGTYSGSYSMTGFTGAVTFTISANGSVTGIATGFQAFETPIAGSLTRNNVIVLTGSTGGAGLGEAVFFTGSLNTANFTVTGGTAGTSLNGGVTGAWTAVKAAVGG
ncbi:MAG: hypothetical protein ACYDCO_17635 [Armatimonadota bacterium]